MTPLASATGVRTLALAALVASALFSCGQRPREAAPASTTRAEAPLETVAVWSRLELSFDVEHGARAPDDVAVEASFVAPSGAILTTPGFAARGRFYVRFTPREAGVYVYRVRADAGEGHREVASGSLNAVDVRRARGFVRVSPRHPHELVGDDGSRVIVLGENRINVYDPSWNYARLGVDAYVERMAAFGMTAIRVFLLSDCESETTPGGYQIGCLEPRIGRFDEGTAEAIDALFDAAERHGVDVVLVAFAIGFTPGAETWRSWADNPYSMERGGPAATPSDFFADPSLRAHAARKLRYIAARWAASPRLLAIDLLNEPEWDGPIGEATWIPWAKEMSAAWRAVDPYGHLVTAGPVGLAWNVEGDEGAWYASPRNDIVQWHLYGKEFYDPHALAAEVTRRVRETWGYGKPVLCGEFAYGGEPKPDYEHTHVGIWSLALSGAGALAHSAPAFEIDSDEPMTPERARHFSTLSRFLGMFDPKRALLPRDDVVVSRGYAWSLVTDDASARALWVLGPKEEEGRVVEAIEVGFPAPPAGRWRATWIDDVTGAVLESTVFATDGAGRTTLRAPPFRRHVAARIARE